MLLVGEALATSTSTSAFLAFGVDGTELEFTDRSESVDSKLNCVDVL